MWISKFCQFIEAVVTRMSLMSGYVLAATLSIVLIAASPLFMIALVGVLIWKLQPVRQINATHGSARWANMKDLIRAGCVFQPSGMVLGRFRQGVPLRFTDALFALFFLPLRRSHEAIAIASQASAKPVAVSVVLPNDYPHMSVYGPSGTGKSSCFVVPAAREVSDNMVILDPKGELARLMAKHRHRKFGHEIVVIDPFGVAKGCGFEAATFNPASLFRDNHETLVDEARRMASAVIVNTGAEKDPFWNKASNVLVTGVLAFLMAEASPEHANFNRLRDILTNPELMEQTISYMQQSQACGGLLQRLAGQMSQLQGQTKASVFSVANSHLEFLDSPGQESPLRRPRRKRRVQPTGFTEYF
ncbi:MAG: type IV secretory system conjugative DNA transfer family protein [Pirellulaceae bacterium]